MNKPALFALLTLAACAPTPRPDYAIRVEPTPTGGVAEPPQCPSWATATTNPFDNAPMPQLGCADARNLAAETERPNDLLEGRDLGPERGVIAVGAMRRYDNNQTRGLIEPGPEDNQAAATTSPSASSALTGDVTGGAGSSAASSASGGGAAAP